MACIGQNQSPLFKLIKYKIAIFYEIYILFHFNIILSTTGCPLLKLFFCECSLEFCITSLPFHLVMKEICYIYTSLCTRFSSCNNFMGKKGKGHPCTGTEALYRLYGPQEEQRYSSTLSWPWHQKGVRSEHHAPVALYPLERTSTHCTGGWVGPRAGLDRCGKSRLPHRDSIPGPSSPQPVAILTTLPGPWNPLHTVLNFHSFMNSITASRTALYTGTVLLRWEVICEHSRSV